MRASVPAFRQSPAPPPRAQRRFIDTFVCLFPLALLFGCSSRPPPAPPPLALTQAQRDSQAAEQFAQADNWPAALAQWQSAADRYRLLNRLPELAVALHNTGQAHRYLEQFSEAEASLARAAELNAMLGRRSEWWRNQIALLQIEALTDPGSRFQELIPHASELTDPSLAGLYFNELALWQERRHQPEAEETFHRAHQNFIAVGDHAGQGTVLANLARLRERAQDPESAVPLWEQSLHQFELAADPRGITQAMLGQGRSMLAAGRDSQIPNELLRRAAANFKTLQALEDYTNTLHLIQSEGTPR